MSVKISGILKDGMGNPIPNCTIELKSKKTSLNVITKTETRLNLDITGSYSMNVEPCHYDVSLCMVGYPPKHVGDIHVYSDSRPGTLNDFLMMPEESDLTPEVILIFQQLRDEAKEAAESVISSAQSASADADSAATSATAAAISETNAGQSAQSASADAEIAVASAAAAASSETNAGQSAHLASTDAERAASSAAAAAISETNAGQSAQSASTDAERAATSAAAAASSETNAGQSAQSASTDAESAAASATAAASSETNAGQSAQSASTDAESAAASAAAAASSETNAKDSEIAAANSAASMEDSVTQSTASAAAAFSEANRAKEEADRAVAASDGKQDKLNISDLGKEIIAAESAEDARSAIDAADVNKLKSAAYKDIGTTAGTVAAGDDNRLNTVQGKSGGVITKDVEISDGSLVIDRSANYQANAIALGIAGGAIADWQARGSAISLSAPNADTSAYSLIKATQWGRAHLYGLDVHYPTGGDVQLLEHIGGVAAFVRTSSGTSHQSGSVVCASVVQTSDKNYKDNVEFIGDALNKLSELKGCTYVLKDTGQVSAGVIAQDLQKVLPEAVKKIERTVEDERYYKERDYMNMTKVEELLTTEYSGVDALLVNAVNELHEIVKKQAKEIETLKHK